MDKARYHRDQAALCLQMARLISDPIAARLMRMAAARHFEQVAKGISTSHRAIGSSGEIQLTLAICSPSGMLS